MSHVILGFFPTKIYTFDFRLHKFVFLVPLEVRQSWSEFLCVGHSRKTCDLVGSIFSIICSMARYTVISDFAATIFISSHHMLYGTLRYIAVNDVDNLNLKLSNKHFQFCIRMS